MTVMVETTPRNDGNPKRGHKPEAVRHVKMLVIDSLKAMDTDSKVKVNVTPRAIVISDDSTSYTEFKSIVKKHHARVTPKGQIGKVIPRRHIATSKAKRSRLISFTT